MHCLSPLRFIKAGILALSLGALSADPAAPRIVVIDPGHGGNDSGTTFKDHEEKDVVLAVARKLAEILEEEGKNPVLTRQADDSVSLQDRAAAGSAEVFCFLSLHLHSIDEETAKGIVIFLPKRGRDNAAASLAIATHLKQTLEATAHRPKVVIRQSADFVLENTACPALVINLGHLVSSGGDQDLLELKVQQDLATALGKGIDLAIKQPTGAEIR